MKDSFRVDVTWPVSDLRNPACQLSSGWNTDGGDMCGQNSPPCARENAFEYDQIKTQPATSHMGSSVVPELLNHSSKWPHLSCDNLFGSRGRIFKSSKHNKGRQQSADTAYTGTEQNYAHQRIRFFECGHYHNITLTDVRVKGTWTRRNKNGPEFCTSRSALSKERASGQTACITLW